MNLCKILIPAALMLVSPVQQPVYAQPTTYAVTVETRAAGSMTISGPGVMIHSDWTATNPLSPFVPEVLGNINGDLIHWNGDGLTGQVIYNWLHSPPLGESAILAGRTLAFSASGPGRAVYLSAANDRDYSVRLDFDGWVETRGCDLTVTVAAWPVHPGDENRDGFRSVADIWTFTERFVRRFPQADFNGDGAITPQDLFDFLAAYFTP